VIRLPSVTSARLQRRQILRVGFAAAVALGVTELAAAIVPYIRVTRIIGLGAPVAIGTASDILRQFAATNDRPILFREGRFFLLHAPGGIIAAYRKCTHLGCTVPFNTAQDLFECPCHGSRFDKHTAVVVRTPRRSRYSSFISANRRAAR
jgi:cytochrome b6-f complex iron-sulfur subunit